MKRVMTCLLAMALVLSIGVSEVFAAGYGRNRNGDRICGRTGNVCVRQNREGRFNRTCHVDTDGDGICDFAGKQDAGNRGTNFIDTDDDGVCDNRNGDGGANFTDADGDGICDNRAENRQGKGSGAGQGNGRRRGCR